jgi:hypothetical protein
MLPFRRFASLAIGAVLAVASLEFVGCSSLNPTPPNPHETDPDPGKLTDPSDAGLDASEDAP